MSIVPVKPAAENTSLALSRDRAPRADVLACPTCGMNWTQFKQAGLMGCPHDYELFGIRLLPLLKRAQEGAVDHVGKVPPRRKTAESERQVAALRLRRELQRAIEAEKYEEAANLRDQLRHLEQN
jgi:protein arginine kinase activator